MRNIDKKRINGCLPGGQAIWALNRKFRQAGMFGLKVPSSESIMGTWEYGNAITVSDAWTGVCDLWRTNRYGVYRRGFEQSLGKHVKSSVVWIENGVDYTFEVPDVKDPTDSNKGLRQASGMLDFDLDKLQYNEGMRVVSVVPGFNPKRDVTVIDIIRPYGWALTDSAGYPLRTKPSEIMVSEARCSNTLRTGEFENGATGWHGSVSRNVFDYDYNDRRILTRGNWENKSGVALIGPETSG
jgi:hypothetical protein